MKGVVEVKWWRVCESRVSRMDEVLAEHQAQLMARALADIHAKAVSGCVEGRLEERVSASDSGLVVTYQGYWRLSGALSAAPSGIAA